MLTDLVLIHRTGPAIAPEGGAWVVWKTCLRQIYLSRRPVGSATIDFPLLQGDEVFYEADAYRFLLEVLCGLHSRVLGENEIVSQFKKRFFEEELPSEVSGDFRKLAQSLLADMKQVRREHPLNLGAHSYGSYCRKETERDSRITIVGTGELTLSILPWISKKSEIQILYRSEKGRDSLISKAGGIAVPVHCVSVSTEVLDLSGALVIAAPMGAREIEAMIARAEVKPSRLIDLRGEAEKDPLLPIESPDGSDLPVLDLQDFFRETEISNRAASAARMAALARVAKLAEARLESDSIQIRTQGWEDLVG